MAERELETIQEDSLEEKLKHWKYNDLEFSFITMAGSTFASGIVWLVLILILRRIDILMAFIIVMTPAFMWGGVMMFWIPRKLAKLDSEWAFERKYDIASVFLVIIMIIINASIIIISQLNLAIIEAVLMMILMMYLLFAAWGAVPSNRIAFWIAIVFVIGLGIMLFTDSPIIESLSSLHVEIIGAFVGLFSAIAIGEIVKVIEGLRSGRNLQFLILDELVDLENQLKTNARNQLPTPIWSAALADGSMMKLPSEFRKRATNAYKDIHYFNLNVHLENYRTDALKSICEVME